MNAEHKSNPVLHRFYRRYLHEAETASFIKAISERYTTGTLMRLARSGDRNSRRAAVMALGLLGGYECNATLGQALRDQDRGVRMIAETGIRQVWARAGNAAQRQRLSAIVRLNGTYQYREAWERSSQLIAQAPGFAEAWNQRAVAHHGLEQYEESIDDCYQTLELNPFHFGAAAGMGMCHLELGDPIAALERFDHALHLNPDLDGIRAQAVRLQRVLRRE